MIRRVAILGEMGTGNLGDDYGFLLLRDELLAAFSELDVLVNVLPLSGQAGLDMNTWHAVVTGCGTLLDEVRGAYVHRLLVADCPIAILGTGTADSRYATPTPEGRRALRNVLKVSSYTWRRGEEGPDTGWLAGWRRLDQAVDSGACGINEGPAAHNLAPLDPERIIDVRSRLHRPSRLVAAFVHDLNHLTPLLMRGEPDAFMVDGTRRSFAALSSLSTILCRRIHLGVMAACCGVHPVLLDYSAKVRKVFEGTSVAHTILPPESTNTDIARTLDGNLPSPDRTTVEEAQTACRDHVRRAASAIAAEWGIAP